MARIPELFDKSATAEQSQLVQRRPGLWLCDHGHARNSPVDVFAGRPQLQATVIDSLILLAWSVASRADGEATSFRVKKHPRAALSRSAMPMRSRRELRFKRPPLICATAGNRSCPVPSPASLCLRHRHRQPAGCTARYPASASRPRLEAERLLGHQLPRRRRGHRKGQVNTERALASVGHTGGIVPLGRFPPRGGTRRR